MYGKMGFWRGFEIVNFLKTDASAAPSRPKICKNPLIFEFLLCFSQIEWGYSLDKIRGM
jgi:hypothetical protein